MRPKSTLKRFNDSLKEPEAFFAGRLGRIGIIGQRLGLDGGAQVDTTSSLRRAGKFRRQSANLSQVELPGAEHRKRLDVKELV